MERSTRPGGTSSTGMPSEASTRPRPPGTSPGLWAPWIETSAQPSSSSPLSTTRSARRSLTIWLGRISRSWGFWLPRASESTSTRSPPTASTSDFRSVVVVTTRTLPALSRGGALTLKASPTNRAVSAKLGILWRTSSLLSLEQVGGMGAENEGPLEEDLVDGLGATRARPLGVLEAEPEAQELGGEEAHIGPDRPLVARPRRELCVVVPEAEDP